MISSVGLVETYLYYDYVIKLRHFPRYWPFVLGIHRSPVNSPHKGQWRGGLMFSLIFAWMNAWVNNREAGYFRHHRAHYDVSVMIYRKPCRVRLCSNSKKWYYYNAVIVRWYGCIFKLNVGGGFCVCPESSIGYVFDAPLTGAGAFPLPSTILDGVTSVSRSGNAPCPC